MGASIPLVIGKAHIERDKVDGATRFRWVCSCTKPSEWPKPRVSPWKRSVMTTAEAFRQHWTSVHSELRPTPDWDYILNRVAEWAVLGAAPDEVQEKRETFAPIYGVARKASTTTAISFAAISFDCLPVEEKVGMSRFDDIQARLRELEKEAAKYARFERADPWPVGAVVVYDQESTTGELYTYGVLKCANGKWYWTGHGVFTKSGASYDHLVEHLAHERTTNIRVALPEDFEPLFETLEEAVGPEVTAKVEEALKEPGSFIPRLRTE